MAKISLGQRPASFECTVQVPVFGGSTDELPVKFKYRTRTELAAFNDERRAADKAIFDPLLARAEEAKADKTKMPPGEREYAEANLQSNTAYVMGVVESWGLEEPFTPENVRKVLDLHDGAAAAIGEAYRKVLTEARSGN